MTANVLGQKQVGKSREIVVAGRTMHVPDVWVVNQNGKRVRFYSDSFKDKSVAIGFFFTSCLSVCTWHGRLIFGFSKAARQPFGKGSIPDLSEYGSVDK